MSPRTAVAAIATHQDGLISIDQALGRGLTEHTIRGLRRRGDWVEVLPRVVRPVESDATPRSLIRAAALWAGEQSCVTGVAAAYWWGLVPDPPTIVTIAIPRDRRLRPRGKVMVTRRVVPTTDRALVRGITVTTRALTALDAAVQIGGTAGAGVLDRALQTSVTLDEVRAAHYRSLGRHGSRAAGVLIAAAADGAGAASERLFLKLLKRAGIGGWRVNHAVDAGGLGCVLDVAFLRERLAIEIDGWAWHHTPDRFRRDRIRQNALVNAGWRVLRFTWFDLIERPEYVIAEVRRALARVA